MPMPNASDSMGHIAPRFRRTLMLQEGGRKVAAHFVAGAVLTHADAPPPDACAPTLIDTVPGSGAAFGRHMEHEVPTWTPLEEAGLGSEAVRGGKDSKMQEECPDARMEELEHAYSILEDEMDELAGGDTAWPTQGTPSRRGRERRIARQEAVSALKEVSDPIRFVFWSPPTPLLGNVQQRTVPERRALGRELALPPAEDGRRA